MDPWQEMDDWCQKRIAALSVPIAKRVMGGGNLYAPAHQKQIGEATAFSRMRSYISHARSTLPNTSQEHPQ